MTFFIGQDARSTLWDGIETIVIPLQHTNDLQHLALQSERGPHAVVEWLLSQLGRSTEIERVCGLSVGVQGTKAVVNLELRQPGKQIEAWLRVPLTGANGEVRDVANALMVLAGYLSVRSLSLDKFTEKYPPWWLPKTKVIVDG